MIRTMEQFNEKAGTCTKCLDEKLTGADVIGIKHTVKVFLDITE